MPRQFGIGDNSLNIEPSLDNAAWNRGWLEDYITEWNQWKDTALVPIVAGSDPPLVAVNTNIHLLEWDQDATTTDAIILNFGLPGWWEADEMDLHLIVPHRKVGTTDDNTDLQLASQMYWIDRTTGAYSTLTTVASATCSTTMDDGVDGSGFSNLDIDIGARLRAESADILVPSAVAISLYPNETVSPGTNDLQICPPILRIRRHVKGFNSIA